MPHITSEVSNSPQDGSIIGLTDSITENPAGDYPLFFRGRRRLAPLPQKKPGVVLTPEESLQSPEKHPLGFEYGEHFFLGNSISLRLENGTAKYGKDVPLKLPNGIVLTYGNINGLAGDFYATNEPICDGGTFQEQVTRFAAAFNTLATGYPETKDEVKKILDLMQTEVDAVNKAIANKIDPSTVYPGLPNIDAQLQLATVWRWYKRTGIPAYLGISEINLDHFGDDARLAYLAGHYCACKIASSAKDLMAAYAINAFADHFLEDSFSAGHMRTPRRLLHTGSLPGDKCAKFMHDEDSAIGLEVSNSKAKWTAYGDKRLLDKEDQMNTSMCLQALQASSAQVYSCWASGSMPSLPDLGIAFEYAPTLSSARGQQTLAPLFTFDQRRRKDIDNRKDWVFTDDWWFITTLGLLEASKRWNYPITM